MHAEHPRESEEEGDSLIDHLERIFALPEDERPAAIEELARRNPAYGDPSLWKSLGLQGTPRSTSSTRPRLPVEEWGRADRYVFQEELARGGMGRILRYPDRELGRDLVRKSLITREDLDPATTADLTRRFLLEARITSRLDHPNIVPVHDLGIDEEGRPFFTMAEVRGRTLREVLADGDRDDPSRRIEALRILEQVCQALAFAHSRGIVHRDVKPANVMVGPFAEVYLMDWGLARTVGESERKLHDDPLVDADPLETLPGLVLGTPSYMAPEQARGEVDTIGPTSDVYAVGTILYEILKGHPLHVPRPGEGLLALIERVGRGPGDLEELETRDVPPELASITRKALALELGDRYASAEELARDLRAHLDGRVVRAHAKGPWIELVKWFRRNRRLALPLALTFFLLLAAVLGLFVLFRETEEQLGEILDLATADRLDDLEEGARDLWPLTPAIREDLLEWLREASEVVTDLGKLRDRRTEMRSHAQSRKEETSPSPRRQSLENDLARLEERSTSVTDPASRAILERSIERLQKRITDLEEREAREATRWSFGDGGGLTAREWNWRHGLLSTLVDRLEHFDAGPAVESGLGGGDGTSRPEIENRLAWIDELSHRTLENPEAVQAWREMRRSLAESPGPYTITELEPQFGLLPLGRGDSGLFEFYAPATGRRPVPGERSGEDALTFVLLPSGEYWMGAQSEKPEERHYDEFARPPESPVSRQRVERLFLSKFEMTQGQWRRLMHENPSGHSLESGSLFVRSGAEDRHPVESVTWLEARQLMDRLGWRLPTEIEWEYAARAGSDHPWGESPSIAIFLESQQANIADESAHRARYNVTFQPGHDDGFPAHAPVGSFRPNAFALHDMLGNVAEFCDAEYLAYPLDPGRSTPRAAEQVISRGMTCLDDAREVRCSRRFALKPNQRVWSTGLRPARSVITSGSSR